MDPRGNSVLPPAAAPSAGSLRPPPPPPSSAAAAAGKGAEETASLPLPTAHAHRRPPVRKSATSERRVARAPNVTGATRRGAGLRRLGGLTQAPRGTCWRGAGRSPTCRSTGVSAVFLLRHSKAGRKSTEGGLRLPSGPTPPSTPPQACSPTPCAKSLRLAPAFRTRVSFLLRSLPTSFSFLKDTWEASVP